MSAMLAQVWEGIAAAFDADLVTRVRTRVMSNDALAYTASTFADAFKCDRATAGLLLERLHAAGLVQQSEVTLCPACRTHLGSDAIDEQRCPCGYSLEHDKPLKERQYYRAGRQERDVRWMVAIHGMNTRGPWQEDFTWRVAQAYGYSVPVFIYKYGHVLVTPLLVLRQRVYRDRLLAQLRKVCSEMSSSQYGARPDIVAHSFGTWLLAHALLKDESQAAGAAPVERLKLGRLILTGSIVRPDFCWDRFIADGVVESVLCHCGGRDRWVRLAHFVIPDSGPSGHRGFNGPTPAIHVLEEGFAHSDYFRPASLSGFVSGTWHRFLTHPSDQLEDIGTPGLPRAEQWAPSWWRFPSHALKCFVLLVLVALVGMLATAVVLGVDTLVRVFGLYS